MSQQTPSTTILKKDNFVHVAHGFSYLRMPLNLSYFKKYLNSV
jgi:hypothetical protein